MRCYSDLNFTVETSSVINTEELLKTLQDEGKAEEYFSGGGEKFDTWCGCGNMYIYKVHIGTVIKEGSADSMIAIAKYIRHVLKDNFIKLSGTIIGQEGHYTMEMDKND